MLLGSLVNDAAILAGSAVGLFLRFILRRSSRRSESENGIGDRLQKIVMQGLALCTMYIGISGSLKGQNTLLAILSLVIGAVIGEILDLDGAMNRAGNWVQKKVTHPGEESAASTVAEGFVTASLLFGVGAMSIVGSLNSGLLGDHTMLFAKSLLDGVSSVVFSVSFGIGVPLSAIAVFVYEALITLAASVLAPLLSDAVIAEMTCVGSLMIIGLALNMLGLTKIKVTPPFFFRSCFAGLCDGRSYINFEPGSLVRGGFFIEWKPRPDMHRGGALVLFHGERDIKRFAYVPDGVLFPHIGDHHPQLRYLPAQFPQ